MKAKNLAFASVLSIALVACSTPAENETSTTETVAEEVETSANVEVEEDVEEEIKLIQLNQIPGEFTNGDLTLEAGTYKFEVQNSGVDHEVGLVLAPKSDEITEADHIQNAYVTQVVKDGEVQECKGEVTLEKGEYVYFCPLNPTPQYTITVE